MHEKAFVFALLTAVIWGMAPAVEKAGLAGRLDPYVGVVIRTIPITITSLAGLLFMGRWNELAQVDARSALLVTAGGLLAGFLGQLTLYTALKAGEASVVVSIAATYPLVALVVSVLFLGESLTLQKAAGAALVVGGVILLK